MIVIPRGIRANNPLNLRPGKQAWLGQNAIVDGYCVFDTAAHGLRAGCLQLVIYQDAHQRRTVTTIINAWAPNNENDSAAYVADVCRRTHFGPLDTLDLHSPATLSLITTAMIWHENGQMPYSRAEIATAVAAALKGA